MTEEDDDPFLRVLGAGLVYDDANNQLLTGCECDNTHATSGMTCRWCWAYGRRRWGAPDVIPEDYDD